MILQRWLTGALLSLSVSTLGACTAEGEPTPPANERPSDPPVTPPTDPEKPKPPSISWASCTIPDPSGGGPIEADCATMDMPARRSDPTSGTTPVAVYRIKSKTLAPTAQMWLLNGGPGGAGYGLAPFARIVAALEMGIDAYLIDHRGTGESDYFDCPIASGTATSSIEFATECSAELRKARGPRFDGASTTESANDVKDLVALAATPGQKVFLYGGSYGSYLAHRVLQLPDVHFDAVVTDGNCFSSSCKFDVPQTLAVDEPMKFVLDACKETPECSARLGPDPWAFASATLTKVAGGHCSATRLSQIAPADLALTIGVYWPQGLMPILYRLDRCSPGDVAVLDELASKLEEMSRGFLVKSLPVFGPTPKPTEAKSYASILTIHVVASEMISKPAPSLADLQAKAAAATFKPDAQTLDLAYFDAWNGYPRDALVDQWVDRDVPWLVLQGTFDFQTPFSMSQKGLPQIKDPSLQFVRVDGGGHGVAFDSKCAISMLQAFLANPRSKVDTACVAEVKSTAMELSDRYTSYFFGTTKAWD